MTARIGPNRGGAFEKWTVRLLLPVLLAALLFALLTGFRDRPLVDWRGWFDGPERGSWRALTLNGKDVFEDRFLVRIADGHIVAGYDGCNYWAAGGIDERTGDRIITSTLAGCIDTPAMAVYRVLAHGETRMELSGEDRLVLAMGKCRGEFRRWTRADEDAERARHEAETAALRQSEQGRVQAQQSPPVAPPPLSALSPPMPPTPPPPPLPAPRVSPSC